jgi:hypothetical protein
MIARHAEDIIARQSIEPHLGYARRRDAGEEDGWANNWRSV